MASKPKTQNLKPNPQAGVALLVSLLLTGVLISIVLTMSIIFIPKIRLGGDIRKSVTALYAAESGMEWCIYVNIHDPDPTLPAMSNSSVFVNAATNITPTVVDCSASSIKIIGTYQGISRSFEISGL